jgi:XTP/dITP diphosphohydrolase
MHKTELIVASGNVGKVREIGQIVATLPITVTSLKDHWQPVPEIEETGDSFLENAMIKARWLRGRRKRSWVLADDSGLEVDALDGQPGVRSARFSGPEANDRRNVEKLLGLLGGHPAERRNARFRCVMVLLGPNGQEHVAEGICEGRITDAPRGEGGFGYDPVFVPDGFDRTFAQIDSETKNRISHRGRALTALKKQMERVFDEQPS